MPRKTKEQKELEIENESKKINKSSTSKTTRSKTTSSKITKATSKVATTKASTRTTKSSAAKTSTRAGKSAAGKPTKSRTSKSTKTAAKSTASKKTKTVASTKTSSSVKKASAKKTQNSKKVSIVEYYDLPYRYNQTVVKVLAQTPTNLFVYWDIADSDRENFKKEYGYDFFDKTRPVLIVHNETMNYAFEVDINDFANSWYLHVNDANCDYKI